MIHQFLCPVTTRVLGGTARMPGVEEVEKIGPEEEEEAAVEGGDEFE